MYAERVDAIVPYSSGGLVRSPGVHVSGLIRAMAIDYGILDRKWVPEDFDLQDITEDGTDSGEWWASLDEDSQVRMAIGMAWEQWYLPRIPRVTHQPGELYLDGIYLTIDGESRDILLIQRSRRDLHRVAVHEVKTTSKSINTTGHLADPNPKNWMWLAQCKAYCKARGTTTLYLHILYLFGDYSYPMRPKLHVWRLEFEQQEIDDVWSLLQDSLHRYRASGRVRPPDPSIVAQACRRRLQQRVLLPQSKPVALSGLHSGA